MEPNKKMSDEVYLDVSAEQYRTMQAKGLDEDALLEPGRHKFVRGLFKQRHPDYAPQQAQVRVSLELDADLLAWLRARALAPYQTQINAELRALMEREATTQAVGKAPAQSIARSAADYSTLLDDPKFIAAVVERVRQALPTRKARRKAA